MRCSIEASCTLDSSNRPEKGFAPQDHLVEGQNTQLSGREGPEEAFMRPLWPNHGVRSPHMSKVKAVALHCCRRRGHKAHFLFARDNVEPTVVAQTASPSQDGCGKWSWSQLQWCRLAAIFCQISSNATDSWAALCQLFVGPTCKSKRVLSLKMTRT